MSGHSKWHSIKHKKGAADAARGKIFTRHANLITLAAREGGGDAEMNPSLRLAIDNAKSVNMPNSNIDRAIKRGTGEDKEGAQFFEVQYEGYGSDGVAVIVNALTDNKNRTVASIRSIFTKNGGSLGETGCVSYMFHKKGVIILQVSSEQTEEVELLAIDLGVEDVQESEEGLEITTPSDTFFTVKEKLESSGAHIVKSELLLILKTQYKLKMKNLLEKYFT